MGFVQSQRGAKMKLAVTVLVFCVAALLALGLVILYSSGMAQVGAHYLIVQLIWCGMGLGVCVAGAALDYKLLQKLAWVLFGLAIVLLALVYVPHIGIRRKGASRWIGFHDISLLQPSEFAKLALIVIVAWYGDRFQRQMPTFKRGVVLPGILIALILGLVFREPDRGTTVLLACVSGTMLLIAGVRWKFIVPPLLASVAALAISILYDPMRRGRVFGWLHLEEHKEGVSYQAYQAMIALGAGGWTGLGLGNGRQKLGFVPEHHTDFILSVIGEELGAVATLAVVLAFVAILICGLYIAVKARETFGMLLASGITFLITLQAFINIGVVTSALPNKGLPLPFISYGGSNLLIMLTSVGILLSVARHGRDEERASANLQQEMSDPNPFKSRSKTR